MAQIYTSSTNKMIKKLLWGRTFPILSITERIMTEMVICENVVTNQAHQWTALLRPIIFITCQNTNSEIWNKQDTETTWKKKRNKIKRVLNLSAKPVCTVWHRGKQHQHVTIWWYKIQTTFQNSGYIRQICYVFLLFGAYLVCCHFKVNNYIYVQVKVILSPLRGT